MTTADTVPGTAPDSQKATNGPPLVVGVSGASGVIYGVRALQMLATCGVSTHLVMSRAGEMTLSYETDLTSADVRALATESHPIGDVGASISSGSFRTRGMLIAPCSVRTMSEIASGVTTTLLTRAADVVLKEHRRLVLMVREAPLHAGHLRTMLQLAEMGAIITPPVPAFYSRPESLDDVVTQTVGRALDLFGIDVGDLKRWGENMATKPSERRR